MPAAKFVKFKYEFCDQLIEHMKQGLSFNSFAGTVGATLNDIKSWEKNYLKFKSARERGEMLELLFWEKMGRAITSGQVKGNVASWVFNMKNRFKWVDEHGLNAKIEQKNLVSELITKLAALKKKGEAFQES